MRRFKPVTVWLITAAVVAASCLALPPSTPPVAVALPRPVTLLSEPIRVLDTRPGASTIDGQGEGEGFRGAATITMVTIGDRGPIESEPDAVVATVTVTDPQAPGYVTAWPCGEVQPNTSNVNFGTGQTIANQVVSKLGEGGRLCLFTSSRTHLLVDVTAVLKTGPAFTPLPRPARLMDSRPGGRTIDGIAQGQGALGSGEVRRIRTRDRADIPTSADAAWLNVTVTTPETGGFLTLFPCADRAPLASHLNFSAGETIANAVMVGISDSGDVCMSSSTSTHVIVDVAGWAEAGDAALTPQLLAQPRRILDTRTGGQTYDGGGRADGPVSGGAGLALEVAGRAGVPANATTVFMNVTTVDPESAGYLTVHACGSPQPNTSNANFRAGQNVAAAVMARLGADGRVRLVTSVRSHLLVDVVGWLADTSQTSAGNAATCDSGSTDVATPPETSPPLSWSQSPSPSSIEACRVPDRRVVRHQVNNVGFPLEGDLTLPHQGTANLIFLPVAFSDLEGEPGPLAEFGPQLDRITAWSEMMSGGRFRYEFQRPTDWIRLTSPSTDYPVEIPMQNGPDLSREAQNRLVEDALRSAGNIFDYAAADGIILHFPADIESVQRDVGGRGIEITTPDGTFNYFFWGGGRYHHVTTTDRREADTGAPPLGRLTAAMKRSRFWAFWIHEMLHSQGLPLHAPGNGFATGLGQDQYGPSLIIGAWDQFRLGWLAEEQVFCAHIDDLESEQVIVTPMEIQGGERQTAIIRVGETQALVVESRRPIGYSDGWPPDIEGLLVYRVDTRYDNDRSGESYGDTGNDSTYSKWAYYLPPDGAGDLRLETDFASFLIREGSSVTADGVRITLEHSAQRDYVRIEAVATR